MTKKVLSIILSISMLLTYCFTVNAENEESDVITSYSPFTDISGHWAEEEIKYMYNSGLVNGVSENEFCPDMTIDKAQFITMVVRALGVEEDIYSLNYSDIDINADWFAGFIGGAVNAGIVENSVFAFLPDEEITRASAAVMLYNALEYAGLLESTGNKVCRYQDVSVDNAELLTAVSALSELNIMVGQDEDYFAAEDSITRAEAAAVVKRLSLTSETVNEVAVLSAENIISLNGDGAYVEIKNLDFHYGLNKLSVEAVADEEDLQLELWIDSLNPLSGTKLGTVLLEKGTTYKEQFALINRAYGTHKAYLRLVGEGEISLKNVSLKIDEIQLSIKENSALSGMRRVQTTLTDINAGGYIEFNGVEFGTGYDTIEITMKNSTAGQMLEAWVDNLKATVIETLDSGDEGVTLKIPIVKADGTKKLSIKAITPVDGTITNIRLYNITGKADLMVASDKFEDDLETSLAEDDYDSYTETGDLKDGDILKLSGVNLSDGFNILTMRMKHEALDYPNVAVTDETGSDVSAYLISILPDENDAYIEVRLDSPDGKKVGVIKNNPIDTGTLYDTQSCYLYGASGIRDVYLKTVGDINWNIGFVKFQERGWYDSGIMTLEAEDMGAVPNDDLDDGVALRAACDAVREDPYTYAGVWIPKGYFDIKTFAGSGATGANFKGLRVMGAGMWYSQLHSQKPNYKDWNACYSTAENTVLNNFAMHGETIQRGWVYNGESTGAICVSGSGANFVSKVWIEHWNAGLWISDGTGVYRNNRIKNTWADGINIHGNGSGVAYERNFMRAMGDDALAIFSNCSDEINLVKNIKIKNNSVSGVWHASGITIWGADKVEINNNLVKDSAGGAGIALNSWGWDTPATSNAWIRNNRVERCGNVNDGGQDQGAFTMTPGYYSESYNSIFYNVYFENNEAIDNPSVLFRISS